MKVELAMRYLELDYSLVQPEMIRFYRDVPSKKVPNLLIDGEPYVESERILKVLEKYAAPRTFLILVMKTKPVEYSKPR